MNQVALFSCRITCAGQRIATRRSPLPANGVARRPTIAVSIGRGDVGKGSKNSSTSCPASRMASAVHLTMSRLPPLTWGTDVDAMITRMSAHLGSGRDGGCGCLDPGKVQKKVRDPAFRGRGHERAEGGQVGPPVSPGAHLLLHLALVEASTPPVP